MEKKLESKDVFLLSQRFNALKNPTQLAQLLKVGYISMEKIVIQPKYRLFEISKKSGGKREILAPSDDLKELQQRLNVFLQCVYLKFCPETAHGFIPGLKEIPQSRGILTNAKVHVGKSFVMNLDIENFFHSISTTHVRQLFLSKPFSFDEDLAACLALLCCYQKKLPVGAPTSPIISNLIMISFDDAMEEFCLRNACAYTRYADDITISSNEKFAKSLVDEVVLKIIQCGFKINEKKFRIQSKYTRQIVTGLKVNEIVNVDRKYIRNLKAVLHDLKLNGWGKAAMKYYKVPKADPKLIHRFLLSVKGKIDFIGCVKGKNDTVYVGLWLRWKECF